MRSARWAVLLSMTACGTPPRTSQSDSAFVLLEKEGIREVLPGTLEVRSHRLANDKGKVTFELEVRSLASETRKVRIAVRFFDAEFRTEYEKGPVVFPESLEGGAVRVLRGSLDFTGMPEGGRIARMGMEARVER